MRGRATALVVVDLVEATFIDSTCIGTLVGAAKRLRATGRQFGVANADANANVDRVLRLTRVTELFDPLPDEHVENLGDERATG